MAEKIELDIDIASVRQELKSLQGELQKTGAEGEDTFKGMMKDAQEYAKAQRDVTQEVEQSTDAVKRADQAAGSFGSRLKSAILNTNVFGRSIGEWGGELKRVTGFLGGGEAAVGKFGGAFKVLGNIIKLSPIGLLAGVVLALIGYFTRFQSGIDKVSQVLAGASAVVNVLIDRFLKLGSSMLNFLSGNFAEAANDLKAAVGGIGDALVDAALAASDLEKRFQELRDASRTSGVEAARLNVELQRAKKIAEDTTQSFARRTAAAQKAAELEKKIADQALDLAAERLAAEQEYFAQNKESGDARDRLAQAEIDFANAQVERNDAIFEGESKLKDLQEERSAKRKKDAEEAQKERDKLLKDLEQLRIEVQDPDSDSRVVAEIEKKYADLIKKAEDGIKKLNEIESKGSLSPEQIAQRKEFGEIIVKLKEQELDAIADALTELAEKELAIEEAQLKGKQALRDKDFAAAKKSIEDVKAIRESEIDVLEQNFDNYIKVMEANGASKEEIERAELEFSKAIQEARLQADLEFQEKLLVINADGDEATIAQIKNRIQKIKAELDGLSISEGPGANDSPITLGSLLGIKPEDMELFDQSVDQIKKGLAEITQARVDAAAVAVQAAEDELNASKDKVDSAEEDLERELALAELGFASDVTKAQQRLDQARKEEAEAAAARQRAIQDQKRAQRTQLIIDSASQASNIALSVTNLVKTWSTLPFGVGLVAAFAQAALIISTLAGIRAKAKAISARDGVQGRVGKSGIVVGPSHEGGGVPLEVEGNEFVYQDGQRISVVNRRATAQHFGLLQAINNDDRPAMATYLDRLTGGVRRNPDVGAAPSGAGNSSSVSMKIADPITHKLFEENNRLQRKLVEIEEARETIIDMGDYILIRRKGREERIEKRRR